MNNGKMDKDFVAAIQTARAQARETGARPARPEVLIEHMTHSAMKCGALGCHTIEATE